MLRRILCLFAAAVLFACVMCTASAERTLTVQSERGRGLFVYFGLVLKDSVHILGFNDLNSWKAGDAGLTTRSLKGRGLGGDATKEAVFSWDGEPWLLVSVRDASGATVLKAVKPDLTASDSASAVETIDINMDGVIYIGSDISYKSFLGCGQSLYLILDIDSGGNTLIRFDRAAGNSEILRCGDVGSHLFPLDGNAFMLECADLNTREAWLEKYDPVTGGFTVHGTRFALPEGRDCLSCPAYDESADTLYYQEGQDIMAAKGADAAGAVRVAGVSDPETNFWNAGGVLASGKYVYFRPDAAVIVDLDADARKADRFTVADTTGSQTVVGALEELAAAYADIETEIDAAERTDADIADSVLKRNAEPDVFVMYVDSLAFKSLYDRGYLPGITAPEVGTAVNAMYPAISEVLARDNRVVAVPVHVEGGTLGINHEALRALGEDPSVFPNDWAGILNKLAELGDKLRGSGQYSVFNPYSTVSELKASLLDAILKSYEYDMLKNGAETFDTPELAETLHALEVLDLPGMGVRESIGKYETLPYRNPIVWENVSVVCGTYADDCVPHPVHVLREGRPMLPLRMAVAVINPYTAHPELAQEFMALLTEYGDAVTAYTVSGEKNEPVADRQMQAKYDELRAEADALKTVNGEADGFAGEERAVRLAELEQNLAVMEKIRWVISEEGLRRFRANSGLLYVCRYSYLDSGAILELKRKYLSGETDLSGFLGNLDEKLREMRREDAA